MFDYLDNDGSGVIDFVEFYQVIIVTELCLSDKVSSIPILLKLRHFLTGYGMGFPWSRRKWKRFA